MAYGTKITQLPENFQLRFGSLYSNQGKKSAGVINLQNGKISSNLASGAKEFDFSSCEILPLLVDPQVHLRIPGQLQKESTLSSLASCIHGGVGALITMPNTVPVIDSLEAVELARKEIASATVTYPVHVELSAAITKGQRGQELVDFKSLARVGKIKFFTDDGHGVAKDDVMEAALKASAEEGFTLLQHAEFPGHGGILAPGPLQERLPVTAYSDEPEVAMIDRDLRLLKKYPGARYHVLHLSSARSLHLIEKAKSEGLPVTCEVSPHHLYFATEEIGNETTSSFKMNPPLRARVDRKALQRGIDSGLVDYIATDHAPHEPAMKTANFKTAAFGTTGVETMLSAVRTLCERGDMNWEKALAAMTVNPANFLNLESYLNGSFSVGGAFHAIVYDARETWNVAAEDFASQSKNSCFIGQKLTGKIIAVFNQGKMFSFE